MVLFHVSPLLPLLTDFLNVIQQAQEQSKQPCGLPCSTDKSSPVYVGRQTDTAPVTASTDIPAMLRTPQALLAFSKPQTHLGQGLSHPWDADGF